MYTLEKTEAILLNSSCVYTIAQSGTSETQVNLYPTVTVLVPREKNLLRGETCSSFLCQMKIFILAAAFKGTTSFTIDQEYKLNLKYRENSCFVYKFLYI